MTNVNKQFETAKAVKILMTLKLDEFYKQFPETLKSMGDYKIKIIVTMD